MPKSGSTFGGLTESCFSYMAYHAMSELQKYLLQPLYGQEWTSELRLIPLDNFYRSFFHGDRPHIQALALIALEKADDPTFR